MSARAPGIAAVAWLACAGMAVAAEEGQLVEVPVDAARAPMPELVPPTFPPVTDRSAQAMEAALVTVVREFCINGVAAAETDVQAAARIGAVAVPDPWQGERFLWETPRTTWSLPSTPRLFFWLGASEIDGFRSCEVLAFEGDRMQLARTALDGLERYADASGFGAPTRVVGPLTDLSRRGYIDLVWDAHGFTASIAEDRGDPALVGLHVSIHAPTTAGGATGERGAGGEAAPQ